MTRVRHGRRSPLTADELLHLAVPHQRTELVRGVLAVREPAGQAHGYVAARVLAALASFVDAAGGRSGRVYAAETGFILQRHPDTVRAADVAFVAAARLGDPATTGFAELAPDLVVEVLSPGDRPGDVLTKVGDWLTAGTQLVWVIDPVRGSARVYRADGSESQLQAGDALDGEHVLPGFRHELTALVR